jgi:hypothetical protein
VPDLNELLINVVGGVALLLVAAFALGSAYNLKRGNDALRWLRPALPALGERTTLQWLGTSVVKLTIAKAKPPFKEMEVLIALEPRDVPFFWIHGRLNGRRDTLIFRGRLRQVPAFDAELIQPRLWTGREALAKIDQSAWTHVLAGESAGMMALASQPQAARRLSEWLVRASQLTPALARLSVRRSGDYQLQWHGVLPRMSAVSAEALITHVRRIGDEASSADHPA